MKTLSDTEILNWLQSQVKIKGAWRSFYFSDARDMGYGNRSGHLTFAMRYSVEGRGNSVREAMTNAILKQPFVPPPIKKRAKKPTVEPSAKE